MLLVLLACAPPSDVKLDGPPVADAGPDQEDSVEAECEANGYAEGGYVCEDCVGGAFTLDAGGSTDPEGRLLAYAWEVVSGSATLSASTGATTTVELPAVAATHAATTTASVVVALTVTDAGGATATDEVELTRSCTGS